MKFENDPHKDRINQAKHGVSFAEAETAVLDPFAIDREDTFAVGEQRYLTLGMSAANRVLVVVTTYRGEAVRIISAWEASTIQKVTYENEKN